MLAVFVAVFSFLRVSGTVLPSRMGIPFVGLAAVLSLSGTVCFSVACSFRYPSLVVYLLGDRCREGGESASFFRQRQRLSSEHLSAQFLFVFSVCVCAKSA